MYQLLYNAATKPKGELIALNREQEQRIKVPKQWPQLPLGKNSKKRRLTQVLSRKNKFKKEIDNFLKGKK